MNDSDFLALLETAPQNERIYKYLLSMRQKLSSYNRIAVSYSGGSDSDIVMDLMELARPDDCGEVKYVFFDTQFEYDATYRHISFVEEKYGITVVRRIPKMSIPAACKKHGVPFIAKIVSSRLEGLQRHSFNWAPNFESAKIEGPCAAGLNWFYNKNSKPKKGESDQFNISKFRMLSDFIVEYPPTFAISDKCCDYTKKYPAKDFNDEYVPDLVILGLRQSESGRRIASRSSCFKPRGGERNFDEFCPLWFWTDTDKKTYKQWRGLRNSDCYEIWGMKRTGCIGCPCNSRAEQELKIISKFEPKKAKAAYAVFGESYEYRRKYSLFKKHGGLDQIALEGYE